MRPSTLLPAPGPVPSPVLSVCVKTPVLCYGECVAEWWQRVSNRVFMYTSRAP